MLNEGASSEVNGSHMHNLLFKEGLAPDRACQDWIHYMQHYFLTLQNFIKPSRDPPPPLPCVPFTDPENPLVSVTKLNTWLCIQCSAMPFQQGDFLPQLIYGMSDFDSGASAHSIHNVLFLFHIPDGINLADWDAALQCSGEKIDIKPVNHLLVTTNAQPNWNFWDICHDYTRWPTNFVNL